MNMVFLALKFLYCQVKLSEISSWVVGWPEVKPVVVGLAEVDVSVVVWVTKLVDWTAVEGVVVGSVLAGSLVVVSVAEVIKQFP